MEGESNASLLTVEKSGSIHPCGDSSWNIFKGKHREGCSCLKSPNEVGMDGLLDARKDGWMEEREDVLTQRKLRRRTFREP